MTQKQPVDRFKRFVALVAMLHAQGFTFARIAQELGVHERTMYKWLSKQRKVGPLALGALENLVTKGSG